MTCGARANAGRAAAVVTGRDRARWSLFFRVGGRDSPGEIRVTRAAGLGRLPTLGRRRRRFRVTVVGWVPMTVVSAGPGVPVVVGDRGDRAAVRSLAPCRPSTTVSGSSDGFVVRETSPNPFT